MVGTWVGNVVLQRSLGEGGMGAVYLGYDPKLKRHVAVKTLLPGSLSDPQRLARLESEAVAQSRLQHANIATVYSLIEEGGGYFLIMEYVKGEALDRLLRRHGPLAPGDAVALLIQALRAIDYAHSMGVVHRDLKPSNLMIEPNGTLKVLDFGIARWDEGKKLTKTGGVIGTPEYMSPEQVRGDAVDGRTDVYALGIILFEVLTGRQPLSRASSFETMQAQVQAMPARLSEAMPGAPAELVDGIARALEKSADSRFATAGEWAAELEALSPTLAREGQLPLDVSPIAQGELERLRREGDQARPPTRPLVAERPRTNPLVIVLAITIPVLLVTGAVLQMQGRPPPIEKPTIAGVVAPLEEGRRHPSDRDLAEVESLVGVLGECLIAGAGATAQRKASPELARRLSPAVDRLLNLANACQADLPLWYKYWRGLASYMWFWKIVFDSGSHDGAAAFIGNALDDWNALALQLSEADDVLRRNAKELIPRAIEDQYAVLFPNEAKSNARVQSLKHSFQ